MKQMVANLHAGVFETNVWIITVTGLVGVLRSELQRCQAGRLFYRTVRTMHESYMRMALAQAQQAADLDEVPVGAVIVKHDKVIAAAHNQREQLRDPTAHAEMIAITQAGEVCGSWHLTDCIIYVTLEPCLMCAGAILNARIPLLVYGAADSKAGAVHSLYQVLHERLNHETQVVSGILHQPCGEMLTTFFQQKRQIRSKNGK